MGEAAIKLRALKARYLKAADEYNEEHRLPGMHLGPITRGTKSVLEAIVGFIGVGKAWPSYDRLAELARVSTATVGRAIVVLRSSGLISWTNTWHWNANVRRVTRTSNTYTLRELIQNTQNEGAPQQVSSKGASQPMPAAASEISRLDAAIGRLMALKPGG